MEEKSIMEKSKGNKLFQTISIILLVPIWVGYFYSLYSGNTGNMNSYSMAALALSLMNADVLLKGEKTQNKVFDVLAHMESILIVVMAIISIVLIIVK